MGRDHYVLVAPGVAIHNDQTSGVQHVLDPLLVLVLDPLYVVFTPFGCLDGGKGLGHNLLMQFSTLISFVAN